MAQETDPASNSSCRENRIIRTNDTEKENFGGALAVARAPHLDHLQLFFFTDRATTMDPMIPSAAIAIIPGNGDL